MAAAPAGEAVQMAVVQVAAAPAQGSNRGDGGWFRQAAMTLAQCFGDAGPAGARAAMVRQLEAQGKTRAHEHGGSGGDDMNSKSLFLLHLL